jgi:hypothetical protein
MPHYTLNTLYVEEAYSLAVAFSTALSAGVDTMHLTYHQVNGVRLNLPGYAPDYLVSQSDFEKVLEIFQGEEYGERLQQQRYLLQFNPTYYFSLLRQAVEAYFPAFDPGV